MTTLHKVRWSDTTTGEMGTSIFLAKSLSAAKTIWHRFNKDRHPDKMDVLQLKADGLYDINMLNQLHEGDEFRLAHLKPDGPAGRYWNDEYEVGKIKYTKGPYDPTRHQYEAYDEHGFLFYIKPYELIVRCQSIPESKWPQYSY